MLRFLRPLAACALVLAVTGARLGAPAPPGRRLDETRPLGDAAELCDAAALETECPAYCDAADDDDDDFDLPEWRRENQQEVLVWGGVAMALVFLFIFGLASSQWVWNTYRTAVALEENVEDLVLEQCDEAKKRIRDFAAPFVICRASELLKLGRLEAHETLRDKHQLTFVDTVRDPFFQRHMTVFVSHQWLGRDHPDPANAHYRAICAALRAIAERAERALEDVYVWIDFSSIPQKAKSVQRLVVLSLPCIAATVDVFLVVAPRAKNDRGELCGVDTYHRRAWCRAEMFAHCSQRGVDVMFYATEAGLRPIFPERRAAAWEARRLDVARLADEAAAEAKGEEDSPGSSGRSSPFPLPHLMTNPSNPTDPSPATITSLGPSTDPTPASSTRLATPSAGATPSSLELTPAPAPEIPARTSPASPFVAEVDAFRGCLGIVHGDLTCCRLKHADGAPCDREELVLPIMGLFDKIYRERASDSLVASVYQMLLKGATRSTEDYFPKYFDYALPNGESIRKPLFGDLPRAIMDRIDEEGGVIRRKQAPYLTPGADTRRDASNMVHHAHSGHARRAYMRSKSHRTASAITQSTRQTRPTASTRQTASTAAVVRSLSGLTPGSMFRSTTILDGNELPELDTHDTAGSVFRRKDEKMKRDKTASVEALGASTNKGVESNVRQYRAMPSMGPAPGWTETRGERSGSSHATGSHFGCHGGSSAPDTPDAVA